MLVSMGRPVRIFVTGATGFVGRFVLRALVAEGRLVRCLVRRGSERDLRGLEALERVEGDVRSPRGLGDAISGCDAVIHLVGIIREFPNLGITFERLHHIATENVLSATAAAGVSRFIHMSALGARPGAPARYHQTKWAAEEAVRGSGMAWTIFRPSVIYGRGDGFITMLADVVRRMPLVPVLGSGEHQLQPVPVEQVATAFARAVNRPATEKHTYEVGGPDAVSMVELLDLIGRAVARARVRKIHVPVGVIAPLARILPRFPVTPDQLLMLEQDNTCDPTAFFRAFDLQPQPLAAGIAQMLAA
jgi:uncharacterized protein YbjT (DUF2867 family)